MTVGIFTTWLLVSGNWPSDFIKAPGMRRWVSELRPWESEPFCPWLLLRLQRQAWPCLPLSLCAAREFHSHFFTEMTPDSQHHKVMGAGLIFQACFSGIKVLSTAFNHMKADIPRALGPTRCCAPAWTIRKIMLGPSQHPAPMVWGCGT